VTYGLDWNPTVGAHADPQHVDQEWADEMVGCLRAISDLGGINSPDTAFGKAPVTLERIVGQSENARGHGP
jgi:hypothetical protein